MRTLKVKFKTGQLVFYRGKSFYARFINSYNLIKYGEKGFSHVGIITQVKNDHVVIHEALASGFVKNDCGKLWLENKIDSGDIEIKFPKKKLTHVLINAEKYLGVGYAWSDIFFIGLAFLIRFKFQITGANRLICSEAVSRILYDSSNKKINLSEEYNTPYDLITPMDVYNSDYL